MTDATESGTPYRAPQPGEMRDWITVKDDLGREVDYLLDGMFDLEINSESYSYLILVEHGSLLDGEGQIVRYNVVENTIDEITDPREWELVLAHAETLRAQHAQTSLS